MVDGLGRRKRALLFSLPVRLLTALSIIAVMTPAPAAAQREGRVHGGEGGRLFNFNCGPGRILVGLRGSTGVLIDNLQAICARVDASGDFTEAGAQGPVFGNDNPQNQHVQCPQGLGVISAAIALNDDHPHIGAIQLTCREFASRTEGGISKVEIRGTGNLEGYETDPAIFIGGSPGGFGGYSSCDDGYATGIRGRAKEYLTAFGLICGRPGPPAGTEPVAGAPPAAPSVDPAFASLINSESSFQTFNFPDRFIRHMDWLGRVEPANGNYGSITFRVVPGLGGRCVSLQSTDVPDHYLRHQDWRVKLSRIDSDGNMRADATFCMVPGLASTTGVSFEAISAPGHFIRHRNFELWLDRPDGSDQYRNDATFLAAPPGGAALGVR